MDTNKSQVNENKSVMVGDRLSQESQPTELSGRELDAAIAKRVMGYSIRVVGREVFTGYAMSERLPFYSDDIGAAMEVVETALQPPATVKIERNRFYYNGKTDEGWRVVIDTPFQVVCVVCASLPEAICRAALKAVENNSDTKTVSASRER